MLRRLLAAVFALLAAVAISTTTTAAFADGPCPDGQTPVATEGGVICVVVTDPGTDGNPGHPGNPGGGGTHSISGCFKADGTKVPCVTDLGTWWPDLQCYAEPYDAPPGTPAWQGHTDGSLWACSRCQRAATASNCTVQILWTAPGQKPGPPTPGVLATVGVGLMRLARAEVHTAPQAPDHTYVGVENWLWVPANQWATLSRKVTAGNTSVTVTARPSQVVWDLGPETVTCYSAGPVWHAGMTDAAQTSCGYVYKASSQSQRGGMYTVSAIIRYAVSWTCTGSCSTASGDLGLVDAPAGTTALEVRQRQTVVIR